MKIVYYWDECSDLCPVKKYLEQYILDQNDSEKQETDKLSILADIHNKIIFAADNYGKDAAFIRKLSGYGLIEIRQRKNKHILIRIVYARYDSRIVLLHAFEKPDNYDTSRIVQENDKEILKAKEYFEKFKFNPKLYEEYC